MEQSFPSAWLDRVRRQLGPDFDHFLDAHQGPFSRSLRLNPRKSFSQNVFSESVQWCPQGRYIDADFIPAHDPAYHAGGYYLQEASSMFLWQALQRFGTGDGLRVLDLSAAPGGKSTLIRSVLPGCYLVANEVVQSRVSILNENLARWGWYDLCVSNNDPRDFQRLPETFDLILVDAPCSGEGLFRRDPRAAEHWSEKHAQHCAARQQRILDDIESSLKPGGHLVYSTCTYNPAENEEQLAAFASKFGYKGVHIPTDPAWRVDDFGISTDAGELPAYRFWPHRTPGSGFFLTMLQKQSGQVVERKDQRRRGRVTQFRTEIRPELNDWFGEHGPQLIHRRGDRLYSIPQRHRQFIEELSQALNLSAPGLPLGSMKGTTFRPSTELAWSPSISSQVPRREIDRETALRYLSHSPFSLPDSPERDLVLLEFDGLTLGWVKILSNGQVKNHYPIPWRLRKPPAFSRKK